MDLTRTRILVTGFTESEARAGIQDLLEEFQERPWIIHPEVHWNSERGAIEVITHYEGHDVGGRLASDEVWDCVIACINFSSEEGITFTIIESVVVEGTA